MEQITNNLANPSWWFTGIFFIVLGIVLTKLVINWIPNSIKTLNKIKKKHLLLAVKKCRQHTVKVNFMTTRYWCLAVVIVLYFVLVILFYALSPQEATKDNHIFYSAIISAYLLLFYLVREREIIDAIIKSHIEWLRITRRSS